MDINIEIWRTMHCRLCINCCKLKLTCRFRNNQCKDDHVFFSRLLHVGIANNSFVDKIINDKAVLAIRDMLVRIRGSVPLTNGSGSDSFIQ